MSKRNGRWLGLARGQIQQGVPIVRRPHRHTENTSPPRDVGHDEADDRLNASIRGVEQALETQKKVLHRFEQHVQAQFTPQHLERAEAAERTVRTLREDLVSLVERWRWKAIATVGRSEDFTECANELVALLEAQ